ncbi:MAG: Hsp33 family molecular chaperone HslO [Clostridia bacterium]|nr:Hsp33 family molecular chaperone HslO [Clostridia bacterium]
MQDRIIKCLAYGGKVSIKCINSTNIVEQARKIHDLSPVTTAALGRLITIGSLMGSILKENDDAITLQIKSNGPIETMIVNSDKNGDVKAYIKNPNIDIPLKQNGKLDVGTAVGKDGMLYIIKDIGLKEPYIGLTPLVSGEIAEDFTEYFAKSEQIPTAVALGVLVNKDGVKSAGGYIVQLMPGATEQDITKLEENLKNIAPISKLLEEEKSLEEIAEIISGDDKLIILGDDINPKYKCDCTRKRMEDGLISLGKTELEDIINTDGKAEIVCRFCKEKYEFSKENLEQLKNECKK